MNSTNQLKKITTKNYQKNKKENVKTMYKGVGPPLRLVVYTLIHNDHSAMRGKKTIHRDQSISV